MLGLVTATLKAPSELAKQLQSWQPRGRPCRGAHTNVHASEIDNSWCNPRHFPLLWRMAEAADLHRHRSNGRHWVCC